MRLYISSACSTKHTFTETINELLDLGFRSIELTGNIKYCEGLVEKVLNFKDKYRLDLILHNYFPFERDEFVINLASKKADIRERTIRYVKNAVALSKELGKDLYSFHPGFRYDLLPRMTDRFFIKADENLNNRNDYYQTLKYISQYIIDSDFKIAVENLSPKNPTETYSFLCTPDDIEEFMFNIKDLPNVGILLDLGHLNVAANLLNFDKFEVLEYLSNHIDRIFEIHLSENNGSKDFHNISELESWQIKYLMDIRKNLNDIPVVLEWHNCASKEAFQTYEMIKMKLE